MLICTMPTVSVLLPIKGDCHYLPLAIRSIQIQSFSDWELIVCKDRINQFCLEFLKELSESDRRISIVNTEGLNLSSAMNKGLRKSKGEFISRFDADDVMLPNRLMLQTKFLKTNTEYIVCGGQIVMIDENNKIMNSLPFYNISDSTLKRKQMTKCPFAHPATTIRREPLLEIGGYSQRYPFAEDFDLWLRLSKLGKFRNLRQPVVAYRVSESQTSQKNRNETQLFMANSYAEYILQGDNREFVEDPVSVKTLMANLNLLHESDKKSLITNYNLKGLEPGSESFKNSTYKPISSIEFLFLEFYRVMRKLGIITNRLSIGFYAHAVTRYRWRVFLIKLNQKSSKSEPRTAR